MRNKVLRTLDSWSLEANSAHNDGYVRRGYWDKIAAVREKINKIYESKDGRRVASKNRKKTG
jgi:hypothetical protein